MLSEKRTGPHAANVATGESSKGAAQFYVTTHRPVDALLERLASVKKTRPDRWQARCPAHDDRSPSLSITETAEGIVLVKCWAGCSASEVVAAVGLELKDLFPPRFDGGSYKASKPPRYSAHEVVKTLLVEATVLMLGYRALQRGDALGLDDDARVELAIQAIGNCREVVNGHR